MSPAGGAFLPEVLLTASVGSSALLAPAVQLRSPEDEKGAPFRPLPQEEPGVGRP